MKLVNPPCTYLILCNTARYPALSADSFSLNSAWVITPFSMRSLVKHSSTLLLGPSSLPIAQSVWTIVVELTGGLIGASNSSPMRYSSLFPAHAIFNVFWHLRLSAWLLSAQVRWRCPPYIPGFQRAGFYADPSAWCCQPGEHSRRRKL